MTKNIYRGKIEKVRKRDESQLQRRSETYSKLMNQIKTNKNIFSITHLLRLMTSAKCPPSRFTMCEDTGGWGWIYDLNI